MRGVIFHTATAHQVHSHYAQRDIMAQHDAPAEGKLWGGRFTGGTDPIMTQYNESIYFDRAFYEQDIRGSIAFARANKKTGLLTEHEFSEIERGFGEVLREWKEDKFVIRPGVDEVCTGARPAAKISMQYSRGALHNVSCFNAYAAF